MLCRSCGTEIAEKALICFRCGAATSDPVRQPYVEKKRSSPAALIAGVVMLAGGAGAMAALPPGMADTTAAIVAGLGGALTLAKLITGRGARRS